MKSLAQAARRLLFRGRMKLIFPEVPVPRDVTTADWLSWQWQLRSALKTKEQFQGAFKLNRDELEGFAGTEVFQVRATPYYARLAGPTNPHDPIRKILMPNRLELATPAQAMLDPLGERKNSPAPRIIHRYPDRVLFLVTDVCSVYCRYCTRKHFTGGEQAFAKKDEYEQAIAYISGRKGIREVILSGGDPLTLSDQVLERVLGDVRAIEHVEIIRIGSRMPVVCPMRVTEELAAMLRRHQPVFMMTHFNHPREITRDAAEALSKLVDHGIPVFNQAVLLNGVNNDASVLQALSRRLLYLRVKPYYVFQCDPSEGTDHLRTSVEESLSIQRELWGRLSGLAMPSFSLDIPDGGGKIGLVPEFEVANSEGRRTYVGWDGIEADYVDPDPSHRRPPIDAEMYRREWEELKAAKDL